jgi:hypothetical protein
VNGNSRLGKIGAFIRVNFGGNGSAPTTGAPHPRLRSAPPWSKVHTKSASVICERGEVIVLPVAARYRFLYSFDMKTILDIDDELLIKAKAASARERKSLTALIEEGLRLRLRGNNAPGRVSPKQVPVYRGKGGLAAGVDPCSNRSLLDTADDGT